MTDQTLDPQLHIHDLGQRARKAARGLLSASTEAKNSDSPAATFSMKRLVFVSSSNLWLRNGSISSISTFSSFLIAVAIAIRVFLESGFSIEMSVLKYPSEMCV